MISLIDDILRTKPVSDLLLKLFKNIGGHTGTVTEPVYKFLPRLLIEHERKLMKECRKANNIHLRMLSNPAAQLIQNICLGLWLPYIIGHLMLLMLPFIGQGIVHMHRIPDHKCQKAYCIRMKRHTFQHDNRFLFRVIFPLVLCNHITARTVDHLPPPLYIIQCIDLQLFLIIMLHQRYGQGLCTCRHHIAHQIHLLYLLRICTCPCIILSRRIIGRILLHIQLTQLLGHAGAVTVPDRIRPPSFYDV